MDYLLQQSSPNTQIITPISKSSSPSYSITSRATAGFMNRKPHMSIRKQDNGIDTDCAEVRFSIYDTGTKISYTSIGIAEDLKLTNSSDQKYDFFIDNEPHEWRAKGSDQRSLVLTNDSGEKVGWFTFPEEENGAATGNKKNIKSKDVGELHIHEALERNSVKTEQVVCSALAVVERLKRRAANVSKVGSAYKQGASCGITTTPYGGGVG